jgi:ssDNA-binding Zn-finger/Zn-ribbon topoisomerase 1
MVTPIAHISRIGKGIYQMAKIKCPKCKSEVDTVSPDIEIEKDRLDLIISCPNCNQTFVTFGQDKKDEIAHETLLKELHNVDQLVETHSQIVLAILAALIAFVSSQFANGPLLGCSYPFSCFWCWCTGIDKLERSTEGRLRITREKLGVGIELRRAQPAGREFPTCTLSVCATGS